MRKKNKNLISKNEISSDDYAGMEEDTIQIFFYLFFENGAKIKYQIAHKQNLFLPM
jgi:hypothetical protein